MNRYSPLATYLLNWYTDHARTLPWRGNKNPYAIWVSEIMLQQTRVETAIPYFNKWMKLFPDIKSLAAASQEQVLKAWEGLGYYNRARSLQRAAQLIVDEYEGALPEDVRDLLRLPGIGPYTAGAIASIAFGADEPALDGNIRRVLARVFDVQEPARSPQGERILWELAAVKPAVKGKPLNTTRP
jgi:A/G-specific adenine glycosylase